MLGVHPSGFYAWLKHPLSRRAKEDARQTDLIRQAWNESGKVYGYRKLHDDLLDQGEQCSPNRVARLASQAGIKAQVGYKRRPGSYGGRPSVVIDNTLDRQFAASAPDKAWVTDITYIRTHEGFAYLAVVIDLYSRRIVGWQMQSRQTTDLVCQALLMAVWRRKPKGTVLIHSDQGTQFTLYFPVNSQAEPEMVKPEAEVGAKPTPAAQHGEGVVLLVEDEAPVRAFASRALRMRGYTVLEADSAEDALRTLEDPGLTVDVFVTDVVMPGMDGPSWVREALKTRPDTRVVFVSGYAEGAFGEEEPSVPNSVFLPKPFSLNQLTETVHEQLH